MLREGLVRGAAPTLEVLSLGARNATRQSSDLLPYLPRYRPFFSALPKDVEEMDLKVLKVPLADLECVTQMLLKIKAQTWVLKSHKGESVAILRIILSQY